MALTVGTDLKIANCDTTLFSGTTQTYATDGDNWVNGNAQLVPKTCADLVTQDTGNTVTTPTYGWELKCTVEGSPSLATSSCNTHFADNEAVGHFVDNIWSRGTNRQPTVSEWGVSFTTRCRSRAQCPLMGCCMLDDAGFEDELRASVPDTVSWTAGDVDGAIASVKESAAGNVANTIFADTLFVANTIMHSKLGRKKT